MRIRSFLAFVISLCITFAFIPVKSFAFSERGNAQFTDVVNTGKANDCPTLDSSLVGSISLGNGDSLKGICMHPTEVYVKVPGTKRQAAEFVATLDHTKLRPGLPALSLTTDTSFLTAYANDFGFEGVFARQVEALGQPGDVLLGISTSGNSKNVLAAAKAAKDNQISVIAFTGETGGQMADFADLLVAIPSKIIMHIQECHIALGHAITARVETLLSEK